MVRLLSVLLTRADFFVCTPTQVRLGEPCIVRLREPLFSHVLQARALANVRFWTWRPLLPTKGPFTGPRDICRPSVRTDQQRLPVVIILLAF